MGAGHDAQRRWRHRPERAPAPWRPPRALPVPAGPGRPRRRLRSARPGWPSGRPRSAWPRMRPGRRRPSACRSCSAAAAPPGIARAMPMSRREAVGDAAERRGCCDDAGGRRRGRGAPVPGERRAGMVTALRPRRSTAMTMASAATATMSGRARRLGSITRKPPVGQGIRGALTTRRLGSGRVSAGTEAVERIRGSHIVRSSAIVRCVSSADLAPVAWQACLCARVRKTPSPLTTPGHRATGEWRSCWPWPRSWPRSSPWSRSTPRAMRRAPGSRRCARRSPGVCMPSRTSATSTRSRCRAPSRSPRRRCRRRSTGRRPAAPLRTSGRSSRRTPRSLEMTVDALRTSIEMAVPAYALPAGGYDTLHRLSERLVRPDARGRTTRMAPWPPVTRRLADGPPHRQHRHRRLRVPVRSPRRDVPGARRQLLLMGWLVLGLGVWSRSPVGWSCDRPGDGQVHRGRHALPSSHRHPAGHHRGPGCRPGCRAAAPVAGRVTSRRSRRRA